MYQDSIAVKPQGERCLEDRWRIASITMLLQTRLFFGPRGPYFSCGVPSAQNVAAPILEHLLPIFIQLQNTMWGYTKYNRGWSGAASVKGFQTF